MKVRFQADADLNQKIVTIVLRREPSINFQTATVAELEGLSDQEVLGIATQEGRILVPHDQTTMPINFVEFISEHDSSGVLIVPQHILPSIAAEEIITIWYASEKEEWYNRICYLPL